MRTSHFKVPWGAFSFRRFTVSLQLLPVGWCDSATLASRTSTGGEKRNIGRVLVRLFIQFLHARVGTILREPHVRNRSAGLSDYLSPVGARWRSGRSLFWVAPSPESDHGEVGTGCAVGSMCLLVYECTNQVVHRYRYHCERIFHNSATYSYLLTFRGTGSINRITGLS